MVGQWASLGSSLVKNTVSVGSIETVSNLTLSSLSRVIWICFIDLAPTPQVRRTCVLNFGNITILPSVVQQFAEGTPRWIQFGTSLLNRKRNSHIKRTIFRQNIPSSRRNAGR